MVMARTVDATLPSALKEAIERSIAEYDAMDPETKRIQGEISILKERLVERELELRGGFDFMWGGKKVRAEPVPLPHGRGEYEHYWEAGELEFRRTGDEGSDAWDVYTTAGGHWRNASGDSAQQAADNMYRELKEDAVGLQGVLG